MPSVIYHLRFGNLSANNSQTLLNWTWDNGKITSTADPNETGQSTGYCKSIFQAIGTIPTSTNNLQIDSWQMEFYSSTGSYSYWESLGGYAYDRPSDVTGQNRGYYEPGTIIYLDSTATYAHEQTSGRYYYKMTNGYYISTAEVTNFYQNIYADVRLTCLGTTFSTRVSSEGGRSKVVNTTNLPSINLLFPNNVSASDFSFQVPNGWFRLFPYYRDSSYRYNIVLTINYSYSAANPSPPQNFYVDGIKTNLTEGYDYATLSWDGGYGGADSSGNARPIIGYDVYKDGSFWQEVTTNSVPLIYPQQLGESYKYQVLTKAEGGYKSGLSSIVTFRAYYSNPSAPTGFLINGESLYTVDFDSIDTTDYVLTWKVGASGDNNGVKSTEIFKDGTSIAVVDAGTSVDQQYTLSGADQLPSTGGPTTYSLKSIGKISGTSSSDMVTAKVLPIDFSAPTGLVVSQSGALLNVRWSTATVAGLENESYTLSYKTVVTSTDSSFAKREVTSTTEPSFQIDLTDTKNNINLIIQANNILTLSTGETISKSTVKTHTFILSFNFNQKWNQVKDSVENNTTYTYSGISLSWYNSSDEGTYTHTLYYKINNGSWLIFYTATSSTPNELLSTTFSNLSSYAAGTIFSFYVQVTSTENISVTFDTKTITKIAPPTIFLRGLETTFSSTTLEEHIRGLVSLDNKVPTSEMVCNITLTYKGESLIKPLNIVGTSITSKDFNIMYTLKDKSDQSLLYQEVITNQNPYPVADLTIKAYYQDFVSCSYSQGARINLDFVTLPLFGAPLLNGLINSQYVNPSSTFTATISDFSWRNAAGGTTSGATLTYQISSSSGNIYPKTASSSDRTITITAPSNVTQDTEYRLFSFVTVAYQNGPTTTYSSGRDKSTTINIARWDSSDITQLIVDETENNVYKGRIILPEKLCSSPNWKNLKSLNITGVDALYSNNSYSEASKVTLPITTISYPGKTYYFTSPNTDNIELTWTNTSDVSFSTRPLSGVEMFDAALAIRKERIGINVNNDFKVENSGDCSTLSINARKDATTAPTIEINNVNSNRILSISKGGVEGAIEYDSTAREFKLINFAVAQQYELPTASSSVLGGVKIGNSLTITNGTLNIPYTIYYSTVEPATPKEGDIWLQPIE